MGQTPTDASVTGTPTALAVDTDRVLLEFPDGKGARLLITESGALGIDVGGHVVVRPVEVWHALALSAQSPPNEPAPARSPDRTPPKDIECTAEKYQSWYCQWPMCQCEKKQEPPNEPAELPAHWNVMEGRTLWHIETDIGDPSGAGRAICSLPKSMKAEAHLIVDAVNALKASKEASATETARPDDPLLCSACGNPLPEGGCNLKSRCNAAAQVNVAAPVIDVATMKESHRTTYWVRIAVGDRELTPSYSAIKGRSEYEAASWRWLLLDEPKPDITTFDDTPAAAATPAPEPVAPALQRIFDFIMAGDAPHWPSLPQTDLASRYYVSLCDLIANEYDAALTSPAPEPVRWMWNAGGEFFRTTRPTSVPHQWTPLYTHPPEVREALRLLKNAMERMDRARNVLTDGKPRQDCNWGMLDTSDLRAALSKGDAK